VLGAGRGGCRHLDIAKELRGLAEIGQHLSMPAHIETMMTSFHATLTQEQIDDPTFAYRVSDDLMSHV